MHCTAKPALRRGFCRFRLSLLATIHWAWRARLGARVRCSAATRLWCLRHRVCV